MRKHSGISEERRKEGNNSLISFYVHCTANAERTLLAETNRRRMTTAESPTEFDGRAAVVPHSLSLTYLHAPHRRWKSEQIQREREKEADWKIDCLLLIVAMWTKFVQLCVIL